MNITLTLDDGLVKEVRKIAVEQDTTLTGLVRAYLEELAAEDAHSGRRRRELEALEDSFRRFQFRSVSGIGSARTCTFDRDHAGR